MQSIYSFRDADAELFPRVQALGLEIPDDEPLPFDPVQLAANFRTEPGLVQQLNEMFDEVFALNDGSKIRFSPALPARNAVLDSTPRLALHFDFVPSVSHSKSTVPAAIRQREQDAQARQAAHEAQTAEIVALISSFMQRVDQARTQGDKFRIAVLGRARKALAPIAAALREASIPFRAVELEQLKGRPEVLDALALARALLNPQDRVAWLGILRAPWCGLALTDLHRLVSADEPETLARAVPDLLSQRLHLLSQEGRLSVLRLLRALEFEPGLHSALPTASLGTWLQQVWLNLGGAGCVDAAAHANLDLLWTCLDALPGGAQDLLGGALDAALDKLTALPDPQAGTDCGVQLMTIHKSKGLEFEVVIVPELHAGSGNNHPGLLSWLERGLARPGDSDDITEFLVAPLQSKGAERSSTKAWVDRVRRARESQETRRVLYVAATRARDELHFFARPAYKDDAGTFTLVEPKNSLLATAWPALESEVRSRFNQWNSTFAIPESSRDQTLESVAASEANNLLIMPAPAQPTLLRRLPADFQPASVSGLQNNSDGQLLVGLADAQLYQRHEGGQLSRALGNAVHALLEALARLRVTQDWPSARTALSRLQPAIVAQVRSAGVNQSQAESIAAKAFDYALKASHDPHGQWILSPHAGAVSEAAWAGVVAGSLRTVRVDRLFRAGLDPLSQGENAWWIIDYKTAHADNLDPAVARPELRALFAPQLQAYAAVLRNLHGAHAQLRAALYYPRMSWFDWWRVEQ
jgi:ATP-dependent exoDNAse (exonuclease V) beta subunit